MGFFSIQIKKYIYIISLYCILFNFAKWIFILPSLLFSLYIIGMKGFLCDRILLFFFGTLLFLYVWQPEQFALHLHKTVASLVSIAPYILLSSLLASYLKACHLESLVSKHLTRHSAKAVPVASVLAVIAPLCACSVIPVITALLRAGTPLAPVMAFWVAAPIMDPEMFVLMLPVFGWNFTIAKLVSAVATGMVAGYIAHFLSHTRSFSDPLRSALFSHQCCVSEHHHGYDEIIWSFWKEKESRDLFVRTLLSTLWFLLRWLSVAFLLESLILFYVPQEAVSSWLSHNENVWSYLIAALSGLPLYVNGYAAIPLVNGMMELGMSPGVGLSFMIAGGASCIPAAVALWGIVNRHVFVTYLSVALLMAIIMGYGFQTLLLAL